MGLLLAALAAGLLLLPLLSLLPPVAPLAGATLVLLGAGMRWRWLLVPAASLAAFTWSTAAATRAVEARWPVAWEGVPVVARGTVEGLPDPQAERGVRVRFVATWAEVQGRRIAVSGRGRWLLQASDAHALRPGATCRLELRLRRPHGAANPGGFDYEGWLLSEGIQATGVVRRASCAPPAGPSVDGQRLALREALARAFPARPAAGVVLALVTGDRALVADAAWETYAATGIVHLMAISGLHVALLSLLVFGIARQVLRLVPRLGLHWPLHKPALVLAFAAGVGYSLFAGYSIPTERTLVMMAVVMACRLVDWQLPALQVLLLALVIVLAGAPLAVHAVGFWLSFGAVAILMLLSGGAQEGSAWRQAIRMQLAVSLLLLPLTLWCFGRLSWVSPLANLLAVPLVTFAIVPLGLAGASLWLAGAGGLANVPWSIAVWLVEALDAVMGHVVGWPAASVRFELPGIIGLAGLLLAVACLFQPLQPRLRWLAPLFLLPVLWPADTRVPQQLRLTVIDVGQGLSVLVETPGHRLLYDTGPPMGPSDDAGQRHVLPTLGRLGVRRLDRLVLSHGDSDHTGGARAILAGIPVADGLGASPPAGAPAIPWQACRAGQRWTWDGWEFAILYPDELQRRHARTDNNRSCVLRIRQGRAAVLLMGDLERLAEWSLLDREGPALRADVLVLGHHGSRTSTSPELLAAVRPRRALVSAGYRNAFRHPSPQVLARLEAAGVPWHNTAHAGAITVTLEASGRHVVREFRRDGARYWQRPAGEAIFAGGTTVFALGGVGVNR